MSKDKKVFGSLGIAAIIVAYFLVTMGYFPRLGLSLFLVALNLAYLVSHKGLSRFSRGFGYLSILFALGLVLRVNEFLTFLNIMASLWFGSVMLLGDNKLGWANVVFAPIVSLSELWTTKPIHWHEFINSQKGKFPWLDWLKTIVITGLVLLIIVPILTSANVLFESYVKSVFDFEQLNMREILKHLMRLMAFSVTFWLLTRMIRIKVQLKKSVGKPWNIMLYLPKAVVSAVLLVFLVSQFQLYTLTSTELAEIGLTHSERTREVFGQLGFVSGVILVLLNIKTTRKNPRWLDWLLVGEAAALILFALISDLNYISAWGLTEKRLWGLVIVGWLVTQFILLAWSWTNSKVSKNYFKLALFISGIALVVVNLAHFDALIYHINNPRTQGGDDLETLARLPADSYSWHLQLEKMRKDCKSQDCDSSDWYRRIVLMYNAKNLQTKYRDLDIRLLNLPEYLTYLRLKGVDLDELESGVYRKKNFLP